MAPGTRTPNGRTLPDKLAGWPRDRNTGLATKTVARLKAVFSLRPATEARAKRQTNEQPLTLKVTGAGAQRREPKAVRFWRPVDRLVI